MWRTDLNPNAGAGVNDGNPAAHPEKAAGAATAHDLKAVQSRLQEFADNDLKEIVILPRGSRLAQGATYIDLHDAAPREFTAMGGMEAGEANWYVAKSDMDYVLWNRLIGVTTPERLDQAGET